MLQSAATSSTTSLKKQWVDHPDEQSQLETKRYSIHFNRSGMICEQRKASNEKEEAAGKSVW